MSDYALKVLSACPKSLFGITTEFNPDGGVVLVESKTGLNNAQASWGGAEFKEEDKIKYLEHLEFLHGRNAIVSFRPTYDISMATSDLDALNRDLDNSKSLIDFAIYSDEIKDVIPRSNAERFHQSKEVQINKHNLMIPEKVSVDMTSADLAEKMTPYAFDCTTFKIIDPYIFEFSEERLNNGGKFFVEATQRKMSFLFELFNQIETHSTYEPSDIKIEVFGRTYKTFGKTKPKDLDEDDILSGLSKLGNLKSFMKKYNVKFIGLDDRGPGKISFHERFFYSEKFIFEIEKSFEEKRGKQLLKFALQQNRDDLRRRFKIDGNYYQADFTISANDLP